MTSSFKHRQLFTIVSLLFLGLPPASWSQVTFSGDSNGRSASVTFELNASTGTLSVVLTNTSLLDTLVPTDLLTAVFFNLPAGVSLSPVSATIPGDSILIYNNFPQLQASTDVSGEWAYAAVSASSAVGSRVGISSSGFDLFGPADRFDTSSNLEGPTSPNGMDFGIASVGDDPATGNRPLHVFPYIKNAVVFELNFQGSLAADSISDVSFQYGTSLNEPSFPGIKPGEPPSTVTR